MNNLRILPGTTKINLLDLDRQALAAFCQHLGEKPFRAVQLLKWLHKNGNTDFDTMTDLSKDFRKLLQENATLQTMDIVFTKTAKDGTYKWLLRLKDGNCIETVYIPEANRGTLCVSSQVGCALNCSFCATGKQGFNRNLTTSEIIGQLWLANKQLALVYPDRSHIITNVVLMGMGEPLLNYAAVLRAINLMMDDDAYGLSKYRVTLSTSGVIPLMQRLKVESPVSLAVSLHAPNNALRDILVPLNKKYPLEALMPVCKDYYAKEPRRAVTFEYVMLDNVNDSPALAKELVNLLRGIPCKVNLIPFNPFPNIGYKRSSLSAIQGFQEILTRAGINTIVRKTRGEDIEAACGQLVGQVEDRIRRKAKLSASS